MKEDFLHYIWKHRLINKQALQTTDGFSIEVLSPGMENHDSGPDFTAASVRIDNTRWAGNVEIHVRSSQWYAHGHDKDDAYDNIILHVVYDCDTIVKKKNGEPIPHLELKKYCKPEMASNYVYLMQNKSTIACAKMHYLVDNFIFSHWLCRLLVCRLEGKATVAKRFLEYFGNNWEQLCLFMLARYLGGKANSGAFGLLIQRTPFGVIIKNHHNPFILEALLFGQAGLLERPTVGGYPKRLVEEYSYLSKKYNLPEKLQKSSWKYARMRPANFPDIRIAQLAAMIHIHEARIFRKMMEPADHKKRVKLFDVNMSDYWKTHYRLGKPTSRRIHKMGIQTVHHILINVMSPLMFVYGKERSQPGLIEHALDMLTGIPPENNRITRIWQQTGRVANHAGETQGMNELYNNYCLPKKCLKCPVGHQVLNKNNFY